MSVVVTNSFISVEPRKTNETKAIRTPKMMPNATRKSRIATMRIPPSICCETRSRKEPKGRAPDAATQHKYRGARAVFQGLRAWKSVFLQHVKSYCGMCSIFLNTLLRGAVQEAETP